MRIPSWFCTLGLLAVGACAGEDVGTTAQPLTNSTPASPDTRGYAVFLELQYQNGDTGTCTGTLVRDDLVLTAAHCSFCTVGGKAFVLGTSTGAPGVKPSTSVGIDDAFTHPDAFPVGAVNCGLSEDSVRSQMEASIEVGLDLGLIRLDEPISSFDATPAKVLLHPPLGFQPVADLADDVVTMIGRGPTESSSSLQTMREGPATIDLYEPALIEPCYGKDEPEIPVLQIDGDDGDTQVQGGDSGGPVIVTWYGQPYVLGAASGHCENGTSYYAPTFTAEAISFLAPMAGWGDSSDPDEDHIPSSSDNCPEVENIDQADAEGDGVGDVCDVCPAHVDPDQSNCNAEAEAAYPQIPLGDACDPRPCPGVDVVWGSPAGGTLVQPAIWPICGVTGDAIASCHYEVPVALTIAPTLDHVAPGDTGFRFCACEDPHATADERAANCGDASAADCAIDGARYASPDVAWSPMAVDGVGADPLTAVTFVTEPTKTVVPFDMIANLEAITGPLPGAPPYDVVDGTIEGVALDGVAWAHAVNLNGASVVSNDFASSYVALDHRVRQVTRWKKIPRYKPAFPWTYCAQCIVEMPWLDVFDGIRTLRVAVGPEDAVEIGPMLNEGAEKLFASDLRRVPAAEPEAALVRAGVARRELVVDEALGRAGVLAVYEDKIAGEILEAPAAGMARRELVAPMRDALLTYGAIDDVLFALDREALWRDDGAGWAAIRLDGDALGAPLAMTYRRLDDALYVLDRDREGAVRLVRIDLQRAQVAVVARALTRLSGGAYGIVASDDGTLLLIAGHGERTELAYVTAGLRPELVTKAALRQRWTDGVVEMREAIHVLEPVEGGFAPRAIARRELERPRRGEGLAPLWR